MSIIAQKFERDRCTLYLVDRLKGRGVGVQTKFLGKLGLEIGAYQKALPIGGSFGEISGSLHLLRSARRPRP